MCDRRQPAPGRNGDHGYQTKLDWPHVLPEHIYQMQMGQAWYQPGPSAFGQQTIQPEISFYGNHLPPHNPFLHSPALHSGPSMPGAHSLQGVPPNWGQPPTSSTPYNAGLLAPVAGPAAAFGATTGRISWEKNSGLTNAQISPLDQPIPYNPYHSALFGQSPNETAAGVPETDVEDRARQHFMNDFKTAPIRMQTPGRGLLCACESITQSWEHLRFAIGAKYGTLADKISPEELFATIVKIRQCCPDFDIGNVNMFRIDQMAAALTKLLLDRFGFRVQMGYVHPQRGEQFFAVLVPWNGDLGEPHARLWVYNNNVDAREWSDVHFEGLMPSPLPESNDCPLPQLVSPIPERGPQGGALSGQVARDPYGSQPDREPLPRNFQEMPLIFPNSVPDSNGAFQNSGAFVYMPQVSPQDGKNNEMAHGAAPGAATHELEQMIATGPSPWPAPGASQKPASVYPDPLLQDQEFPELGAYLDGSWDIAMPDVIDWADAPQTL